MHRTQESLLFLNGGHFQKRNQEVVPETCAEDLKRQMSPHKTVLELHHTAGRMPSPYPSMAAALSPSSAA